MVETATAFVAPSQSMYLRDSDGRTMHVSLGGPILLMPIGVSGRTVAFEMHRYFGQSPVNKKTGAELKNTPSGFWDAFELWDAGGKLVRGNVCVVPVQCDECDGFGFMVDRSSGRNVVGHKCDKCNGNKCVHVKESD